MNKNLFLILLIIFSSQLYSQNYKEHKFILIKNITIGDKDYELGYKPFYGTGIPFGIGFDLLYNLYITDDGNQKCNIYNNNLEYHSNLKIKFLSTTRLLEFNKNNFYKKGDLDFYACYDYKGNILFYIDFNRMNIIDYQFNKDYFISYKNIVFDYTSDHKLVSIINPSNDQEQNKKNFMNDQETKDYIRSNFKELTVDGKNRIILNGKIMTRIFNDYIAYWDEQHAGLTPPKNFSRDCHDLSIKYFYYDSPAVYYGTDKDGNWYWGSSLGSKTSLFIFDKNGWAIDCIKLIDSNEQIYSRPLVYPAIHPLGDIYFLDFDGKSNYLYMMSRTWGYNEDKKGTITENNISIRLRPGNTSLSTGTVNKDQKVIILDKTDIKIKTDKSENYWIKIKTEDGKTGWIMEDQIKSN